MGTYTFGVVLLIFLGSRRLETADVSCESKYPRISSSPGNGFDNLRSVELGAVQDVTKFDLCKLASGKKYLISDYVTMLPKLQSSTGVHSEVTDDISQVTDTTTRTINHNTDVNLGVANIGAKFSYDYQNLVEEMYKTSSVITRNSAKFVMFQLKVMPNTPLDKVFKSHLLDIAQYLQADDEDMAQYQCQMLIRNYGTHYTKTVDVGAMVVRDDYISTKNINKVKKLVEKISGELNANGFGIFNTKTEGSQDRNRDEKVDYEKAVTKSITIAHGGDLLKPTSNSRSASSVYTWLQTLSASDYSNLVPVDRDGDPLYFLITPDVLPQLTYALVVRIHDCVKDAIKEYYLKNTHKGCTKPESESFTINANTYDENACLPGEEYYFGGVYMTCVNSRGVKQNCGSKAQIVNSATGDYSCPDGFKALKLGRFQYAFGKFNEVFWCKKDGRQGQSNKFLFGGLAGRGGSCPKYFRAVPFGKGGSDNSMQYICISSNVDDELAIKKAIKFGGFYSCNMENPYGYNESSCPKGYSHTWMFNAGKTCGFQYCKGRDIFKPSTVPILETPPFMPLPESNKNYVRGLDTEVMITMGCTALIKDRSSGNWELEEYVKKTQEDIWLLLEDTIDIEKAKCTKVSGAERKARAVDDEDKDADVENEEEDEDEDFEK